MVKSSKDSIFRRSEHCTKNNPRLDMFLFFFLAQGRDITQDSHRFRTSCDEYAYKSGFQCIVHCTPRYYTNYCTITHIPLSWRTIRYFNFEWLFFHQARVYFTALPPRVSVSSPNGKLSLDSSLRSFLPPAISIIHSILLGGETKSDIIWKSQL